MQRPMNFCLRRPAKVRLITAQKGHGMIEQIESVNDGKTPPAVLRIAPENGKFLAVFRIQILGRDDRFSHLNRWLRAVEQQTHIDIAVNRAKAAMGEAAELVNLDERRSQPCIEKIGDAQNIAVDVVHLRPSN